MNTTNWIIRITCVFCLAFAGTYSFAQQQGQYSQYMMNYFLVNPGVAGAEDFTDIKMGYRRQWTGINGAPQNYYISGHGPLDKEHGKRRPGKMATPHNSIGAMFSGQKQGVLSHNSGYISYAYHLPLTMKATLSMGAQAGFNQFSIDQDAADWGDAMYDPTIAGRKQTKFDLGVGAWFYTPQFFAGLSSMQIGQSKLDFASKVPGNGTLTRHFYAMAGYKWKVNKQFAVVPSFLFRGTPTAYSIDLNTKCRYKDIAWLGASYRHKDAIVLLAGVSVPLVSLYRHNQRHGNNPMIDIGYSYDFTTSGIRKVSNGSHEIMIGLRIPTFGRVLSPEQFW
jgi:type IX secretion system PorP/SprF family membrane protein